MVAPGSVAANWGRSAGASAYTLVVYGIVPAGDPLQGCTGFDRDEAYAQKNWDRHRVTPEEAEDVFFHEPLVVRSDLRHLKREKRFYALGRTNAERWLLLVFTVSRIRVISVRDMNQNERTIYAKYEKENS